MNAAANMTNEIKNVVVIGVGLSGAELVKQLVAQLPSTHRLVAISNSNVAFFAPAALRAAVVPGWEDKPVVTLSKLVPENSRHKLIINNAVTELHDHHVVLNKTDPDFGNRINFDYVIIATGSNYVFPCRPSRSATNVEEVVQQFRQTQRDIKNSNSILVVGAGPVGIEFAGEVAAQYPDKQVTLVSSSNRLMPAFKSSLGKDLNQQLQSLGVKIVFGTKLNVENLDSGRIEAKDFDLGSAGIVKADYVMVAVGNEPNTSLVSRFDSSATNSFRLVKTKPTLQLESHDNMFAIGDITDTDETKLMFYATSHVPIIVANIVSLIKGQQASKTYKAQGRGTIVVTCGPKGGAGQLPFLGGLVIGSWITTMAKSKGLFVGKFRAAFNH
ncbi:hypothetical protein OIO90_001897 [Microbotryomycetes sp. JL221]|nr:hypothetical protein OIO90_001897 [Microbotryomycetes sp. JL221]